MVSVHRKDILVGALLQRSVAADQIRVNHPLTVNFTGDEDKLSDLALHAMTIKAREEIVGRQTRHGHTTARRLINQAGEFADLS
jgi:hypothetical protein